MVIDIDGVGVATVGGGGVVIGGGIVRRGGEGKESEGGMKVVELNAIVGGELVVDGVVAHVGKV
ncbi:hypothetical protein B1218_38170, partial [Pseudomonas ogarae]